MSYGQITEFEPRVSLDYGEQINLEGKAILEDIDYNVQEISQIVGEILELDYYNRDVPFQSAVNDTVSYDNIRVTEFAFGEYCVNFHRHIDNYTLWCRFKFQPYDIEPDSLFPISGSKLKHSIYALTSENEMIPLGLVKELFHEDRDIFPPYETELPSLIQEYIRQDYKIIELYADGVEDLALPNIVD